MTEEHQCDYLEFLMLGLRFACEDCGLIWEQVGHDENGFFWERVGEKVEA